MRGGLPSANVYARTHAHTHTHKKNLRSDISDSLTVNWGGEKASPSFHFRLPPNQNLKNAENPKERQVCPCNAYTTRAPSACASKLLYPQNGGVGAWAIHGIWWISKKVKFDGARCPFSTFLRLQGDHHCACAQKWCHFSFFSKSFQTKKIKALRPKMTKIASRGWGSCLKAGPLDLSFWSFLTYLHHGIEEAERHLLWKVYKKFEGKVGQMCHRSCSLA